RVAPAASPAPVMKNCPLRKGTLFKALVVPEVCSVQAPDPGEMSVLVNILPPSPTATKVATPEINPNPMAFMPPAGTGAFGVQLLIPSELEYTGLLPLW